MKITNQEQLRDVYGLAKGRAKDKVIANLEKHSIHFIEHTPFIVISTVDKNGKLDASPRGGETGFVKILNDKQLLIPDFKGNNRLDSISNIVESGMIGILFIIPGIDESLRINGRAEIMTSEVFLNNFNTVSKPPVSCIVVDIEEIFLHCAKAFMRSKLWKTTSQLDPSQFPSMGEMLNGQLNSEGDSETREAMIARYQKDL